MNRGTRALAAAACAAAWSVALAGEPVFLPTPNNPRADPLPLVAGAQPGDGLAMQAGAYPAFSLLMGSAQPHANMLTAQSIRDRFFLNYMSGDLKAAFGSPMDTGQKDNTTFAAVARHTAPGAEGDLHVIAADGMHLRAVCAQGGTDCTPGHVWGAMVRLPFEWRPGTTMKIRYRSPHGDHAWAPIWFASGQQVPPAPGTDPWQGFGGPNALYRGGNPFEIDWNDNFSRNAEGVPTGYQIEFGTPDIYGTHWRIPPHATYVADGGGWQFYGHEHVPAFIRAPFDWASGFHNLVGNWRGDGSNLIDLLVDGRLIATIYMEYPQQTYVDPADARSRQVAMHLIIGNQAIPGFSPGARSAIDNDGLTDGWTIVIQEISGWYGNIADPDARRTTPASGVP